MRDRVGVGVRVRVRVRFRVRVRVRVRVRAPDLRCAMMSESTMERKEANPNQASMSAGVVATFQPLAVSRFGWGSDQIAAVNFLSSSLLALPP